MIDLQLVVQNNPSSIVHLSLEDAIKHLFDRYIFTVLSESNKRQIQFDLDQFSYHFRNELMRGKLITKIGQESVSVSILPDNIMKKTTSSQKKKWREKQSAYYESNREKWNAYQREYKKKRYDEDPEYRERILEYSRKKYAANKK